MRETLIYLSHLDHEDTEQQVYLTALLWNFLTFWSMNSKSTLSDWLLTWLVMLFLFDTRLGLW